MGGGSGARDRVQPLASRWLRAARCLAGLRESYDAADLQPARFLRQGAQPGEWESTGDHAEFAMDCQIPPGWLRVRLEMEGGANRPLELHLDTGRGFNSSEVLRLGTAAESFKIDAHWFVPRPVRAIRLAPMDVAGTFRLVSFSLSSTSSMRLYARAARSQLARAIREKRLLHTIAKGVKSLAALRFSTLGQQLLSRSQLTTGHSAFDYRVWIERHKLTRSRRRRMRRQIKTWALAPKISVILPLADASPDALRASIDSISRQLYESWELIVVAGPLLGSQSRALLEDYARADNRICVRALETTDGESVALNHALEHAAGTFLALLASGDTYAEHALFRIASDAMNHPQVDWMYSDEDQLDGTAERVKPFFKPGWSPELALSYMYTGNLSAYRTSLLRSCGGWRREYEGAHHYDLILRMMTRTDRVRHIPDVLYHARESSYSRPADTAATADGVPAARRAVADYCRRIDATATIESIGSQGFHRVRRAVHGHPLVSVVIPTASRRAVIEGNPTWYVLHCVQRIRERSTYDNIEIVVVDNNDMPDELAVLLNAYDITRVSFTQDFNLSAKTNLGAARAAGEFVVFMNDDIEVITSDWVEGMLEYAQDERVGAVGVKLLFPNDRVQHAGMVCTRSGPDHLFYDEDEDAIQRYHPALFPRNLLAVTGACVMVKMSDHRLVGGWNEAMPLNFNDIDLCLKLVEKGRRNVYTPFVTMRHFESASKTNDDRAASRIGRECKKFLEVWRDRAPDDRYYNVNFVSTRPHFLINTLRRGS